MARARLSPTPGTAWRPEPSCDVFVQALSHRITQTCDRKADAERRRPGPGIFSRAFAGDRCSECLCAEYPTRCALQGGHRTTPAKGADMAPQRDMRAAVISVRVPVGTQWLDGDLGMPADAPGIVLFAHGSGSSRRSPRNQFVARALESRGLATLLIDLLTPAEEAIDDQTAEYRFDLMMLAERLVTIVDWLKKRPDTKGLPVGLFGASTGGGAALMAAAARPDDIATVVSRGGRPDLAGQALRHVFAPTMLIVGGLDTPVIQINRDAMDQMGPDVVLEIVPGATHLFQEPGALDRVAELAATWFADRLTPG